MTHILIRISKVWWRANGIFTLGNSSIHPDLTLFWQDTLQGDEFLNPWSDKNNIHHDVAMFKKDFKTAVKSYKNRQLQPNV